MITLVDNHLKYSKSDKLVAILADVWNISKHEMHQYQKSIEAFGYSLKKNYPVIPDNWPLISKNKAADILKGYMVKNTIQSYAEKGWIRSKDGWVYQEEIEQIKTGLDAVKFMFEKKIIGEEKLDGKKYFVLYPTKISNLGNDVIDQKSRAWAKIVQNPVIQDWIKAINLNE